MGAVDLGGDKPKKGKKGLRRAKRRISIRLDMTPMVDIAFLLLIFYMVSTVFAEPQAMEINLPPDKEVETETKESKVLILRVAPDDQMYWNIGDKMDPEAISIEALPKLLTDKLNDVGRDMITLIKVAKAAHYQRWVQILDRIEVVEYRLQQAEKQKLGSSDFSFTYSIGPWTRLDTRKIEKVTGAIESDESEEN